MRSQMTVLSLVILVFLSACTKPSNSPVRGAVQRIAVGNNLVQEACWSEQASMLYQSFDQAQAMYHVYCGDWEWPSARLFQLDAASGDIQSWVNTNNAWQLSLATRMTCMSSEASTLMQATPVIIQQCKLNNGGWPYIALVTAIDGEIYLADGIPSALPLLEQSIAVISGLKNGQVDAQTSAALQYIQNSQTQPLYGVRELQAYYQAMTLGQYYNSIKAFDKSERQYRKALQVHEQVLGINNQANADVLMHIALELSNREQFDAAQDLFDSVDKKIDAQLNPEDYTRLLSYYALHAANQGKFSEAREYAQQATEKRKQRINDKTVSVAASVNSIAPEMYRAEQNDAASLSIQKSLPNHVENAHSLYIEAAMQERLGEAAEGIVLLSEAQALLSAGNNVPPLWEPQMFSLHGVLETSNAAPDEAKTARTLALGLFEERAPGKRPTLLSYLELGKSYVQEKRINDALASFRQAVKIAKGRTNHFRISQLVPYFDTLLRLAEQQPEQKQALYSEIFNAAQLVQTGLTSKDIAQTVARYAESDDDIGRLLTELQKQEFARHKKEQEYQAELGFVLEHGHVQRLQKINRDLQQIDLNLAELGQQVQSLSPRYKQLLAAAINSDDVYQSLGEQEALLQVLVAEQKSYVFFLHKQELNVYAVQISRAELTASINALRSSSIGRGIELADASSDGFDFKKSYVLYEQFFSPIADVIKQGMHLVTVASGPFLSFPFALFVTEEPASQQQTEVAWLIRQNSISLVPSAQSFVYLRNLALPSQADKSLIAFGDYRSANTDLNLLRNSPVNVCQTGQQNSHYYFADLPGTRREVEGVASNFAASKTRLILGSDFNEQSVKAADLYDYRIVYFATHALLPDELECKPEPSLLTSWSEHEHEQSGEDGFITSSEIQALHLNADLVVLSACNTGGADKSGGESLAGLARAFFFAGARALLVTHWNIPDTASAELMRDVFASLRDGRAQNMAQALRIAQLDMINHARQADWSKPEYWAAFTLVGDGSQQLAGI